MSCVVVAPVEDAKGLVGGGGEGLIEADEAYFVVDLEFKSAIDVERTIYA